MTTTPAKPLGGAITKRLVFNTALLTLASFAMQTVHVGFNIFITNRIGAAGIGLFQLTLTVYSMAVTFSCAGVRLGSTRLSIDRLASNPSASLRSSVRLSVGYALVLSTVIATALWVGAPLAARHWLHDPRTLQALRALAFGLPMVAATSAMQGCFVATRQVYKCALSQAAEQGVKIVCVAWSLGLLLPRGMEYACLAIVYGMLGGQAVALLVSLLLLLGSRSVRCKDSSPPARLHDLLHIAAPDAAGMCARSVLLTTEHLLIPRGFAAAGQGKLESMRIYGVVHGMALPLLLYPSAVLSSLSGLLVPEFSVLRVQNNTVGIQLAVRKILRLSLVYGVFAGTMFYAFAAPLAQCVYGNAEPARYLQLLAPLVPIMYLDMSVDGILKGMDEQQASMRYNIIDSALCVVLVWLLLPRMGIQGYILVLYASEIYNFYFSLRRMLQATHTPPPRLPAVLGTCLCAVWAALVPLGLVLAAKAPLPQDSAAVLVAAIAAAGAVYLLSLRFVRFSDSLALAPHPPGC